MERAAGTVELNESQCHALEWAFENNPDVVAQLGDFADEKKIKLWESELKMTTRLVVAPDEAMKIVYYQIAEAEMKRLANENNILYCGHSSQEHLAALKAVESMFPQSVN